MRGSSTFLGFGRCTPQHAFQRVRQHCEEATMADHLVFLFDLGNTGARPGLQAGASSESR